MIDGVLQVLQDGGASKTTKTGIYISVALILLAIAIFTVLYMQYKKVQKSRVEEQQALLIRKGRLDLHRCLDASGQVVVAQTMEKEDAVDKTGTSETAADEPAATTTGERILEAITNGQLVKTLNGFSVAGKKLSKKIDERRGIKPMTPTEQLEAQRYARLSDQTINPLYTFRRRLYEPDEADKQSEASNDSSSNDSSSSSSSSSSGIIDDCSKD